MKNPSRLPAAVFGFVAAASFSWVSSALFKPPVRVQPPSHVDSQIAELGSRFHFRPVLRGDALQGNAADHYRKAAAAMLSGGDDVSEAIEGQDTPDASGFDVWVHVNRESVYGMRRGASCAGSMLHVDYSKGYGAGSIEVGRAIDVASAAAAEALLLCEKGGFSQARSLLTDAALFGGDLARGGGLVHRAFGCRVEFLALRRLAAMVATAPLRGSDLRELHRETAVLDASVHPVLETALSEAAFALGEARRMPLAERDAGFADALAFVAASRKTAESGGLSLADLGAIARARQGSRVLGHASEFSPAAAYAQSAADRLRSAVRAIIVVRIAALALGKAPETIESAYSAIAEPIPPGLDCTLKAGDPPVLRSRGDTGAPDDRPAAPCLFEDAGSVWEWKLEAIQR